MSSGSLLGSTTASATSSFSMGPTVTSITSQKVTTTPKKSKKIYVGGIVAGVVVLLISLSVGIHLMRSKAAPLAQSDVETLDEKFPAISPPFLGTDGTSLHPYHPDSAVLKFLYLHDKLARIIPQKFFLNHEDFTLLQHIPVKELDMKALKELEKKEGVTNADITFFLQMNANMATSAAFGENFHPDSKMLQCFNFAASKKAQMNKGRQILEVFTDWPKQAPTTGCSLVEVLVLSKIKKFRAQVEKKEKNYASFYAALDMKEFVTKQSIWRTSSLPPVVGGTGDCLDLSADVDAKIQQLKNIAGIHFPTQ